MDGGNHEWLRADIGLDRLRPRGRCGRICRRLPRVETRIRADRQRIALVGAGAGGILVFFGFLNWQENRNP